MVTHKKKTKSDTTCEAAQIASGKRKDENTGKAKSGNGIGNAISAE
jgi:hypothetical protein